MQQKGFTLIEMLIVVAIIGIIAAMLIPNLLDALQKAKQKRTMADMRILGTAMFSWLTDQSAERRPAPPRAPRPDAVRHDSWPDSRPLLVSQYIQRLPSTAGKALSDTTFAPTTPTHAGDGHPQRRPRQEHDGGTYTVTGFDPTDYDRDIVWADGFFVRWPQKVTP